MRYQEANLPAPVATAVVGLLAPHTRIKTVEDLEKILIQNESSRILDQKEAEEFTRLSYWSLHRAEEAGKLQVIHAGRKRLYRECDLEQFLMGGLRNVG